MARTRWSALFGAALIATMAAGPVRAAVPTTFVVTTAGDADGSSCLAVCSLRQAINAANLNTPAADLIAFAIAGGPAAIPVLEALPAIMDTVTIDGTTQPGTAVVGSSAGPSANGFHVLASGTTILGLQISGFSRHGILLDGVHDSVIGGDGPSVANRITGNGGDGIAVVGDATAVNNQLLANAIFGNGELAIDLGDDDSLAVGGDISDDDTGPNGFANSPAVSLVSGTPVTEVFVQGGARPNEASARIDLYWASTCPISAGVLGLFPQAEEHLGSDVLPLTTFSGAYSAGATTVTLPAPRSTGFLSATLTTSEGTSELSPCVMIQDPTDLGGSVTINPTGPVDVGTPVHIELTVSNLGPAPHTGPIAGFSVLIGSAVVSSISSAVGACVASEPDAYCTLEVLGVGEVHTVELDLVPTTAGTLYLVAVVADLAALDPNTLNDEVFITINVLAEETAAGAPAGGGAVTTDGEADGATPEDPFETTVTVPAGASSGSVTIAERPDADPPPAGYQFFGQASVITASAEPPATAGSPFVLQFRIDASAVPAEPLVVFRNGVPVPLCTIDPLTDPSATPDPCRLTTEAIGDDLVITVRTSVASTWRYGTLVPFAVTGFFAPVDNGGVLNQVKAGAAVPLKFSLGGDRGMDIFAAGSPSSIGVSCGGSSIDPIEQTVSAGTSSLSYNAESDRYLYVWKTAKAWAGSCRQLVIDFADGSSLTALFTFSR